MRADGDDGHDQQERPEGLGEEWHVDVPQADREHARSGEPGGPRPVQPAKAACDTIAACESIGQQREYQPDDEDDGEEAKNEQVDPGVHGSRVSEEPIRRKLREPPGKVIHGENHSAGESADNIPMLEERLATELRDAMRATDPIRRDTIRQLRSALHNESIAKGRALNEDEDTAVVQRLVNQHRDSIAEFRRGNRDDLVAKEEAELQLLTSYLPAQMSRDTIAAAAKAAIAKVGAAGKGDQGKVMRELAAELKGKADMRTVNEVVQELLA